MKYTLKAYSIWEQGPREKQEDSIFPKHGEIVDTDRLFILCDGMGGHSAGEIASATVCSTMSNYILHNAEPNGDFTDDDFMSALNAAYDALDEKDNGAAKKMGTTLTFLKFHNLGCTIAHIGDSRVYHIRPGRNVEDTEILFQTEDHSLVNDWVRNGVLTREEAKHSKQKNVISRAMQPLEHRFKADIYHSNDIEPGDYFMLCSDGILEQMEDENLKFIFSEKGGDIKNKINILINATAQNHDNHSAILINIVTTEGTIPRKDEPYHAELLMAQVSEESIVANANPSRNNEKLNVKRKSYNRSNRGFKNIVNCIIWAMVVFGAFFLYKTMKDGHVQAKPDEADIVTIPRQDKQPRRNNSLSPTNQSASTLSQIGDSAGNLDAEEENPATQISPDSSNISNTVTSMPAIQLPRLNSGSDIISSDEDKAKEAIRKKQSNKQIIKEY